MKKTFVGFCIVRDKGFRMDPQYGLLPGMYDMRDYAEMEELQPGERIQEVRITVETVDDKL